MMSLTMIGLVLGILVLSLSLFALMNPLVVLAIMLGMSVAWVLAFLSEYESTQLVTLFCWSCLYQIELIPKVVKS